MFFYILIYICNKVYGTVTRLKSKTRNKKKKEKRKKEKKKTEGEQGEGKPLVLLDSSLQAGAIRHSRASSNSPTHYKRHFYCARASEGTWNNGQFLSTKKKTEEEKKVLSNPQTGRNYPEHETHKINNTRSLSGAHEVICDH